MSEIQNDDLCQCPICGRIHRLLGNPPKTVMEQIVRDMQEGVFPRKSSATLREEKMPTGRPVAFRVPRIINDAISKTEFRLFEDEDDARSAASEIGADYDGLYLVADRRAAFFSQPDPRPRYFISKYTDGPATRWNVIDRKTQEWVCRYTTEAEAQQYADELNGVA